MTTVYLGTVGNRHARYLVPRKGLNWRLEVSHHVALNSHFPSTILLKHMLNLKGKFNFCKKNCGCPSGKFAVKGVLIKYQLISVKNRR